MHLASLINEPPSPISLGYYSRDITVVVYVKMVNSNADWQKCYRTRVNSTASEFARFHVNGLHG